MGGQTRKQRHQETELRDQKAWAGSPAASKKKMLSFRRRTQEGLWDAGEGGRAWPGPGDDFIGISPSPS